MRKKQISELLFIIVIYVILIMVTIATLYPMWYVLAASFTNSTELVHNQGIFLWPREFQTGAYKLVFENPLFLGGIKNTLKIMGLSLPLNMVMTILCGYFMARSKSILKKPIVFMIMFTMFFGGGLIPDYLNIRSLGLYNTLWALVLPGAMSVYNAIICKTAIEAIPDSLPESAYIDGANDLQVLFRIIVPLIKPTLAVLLLYYGVSIWNSWFPASIYLTEDSMLPVQNILRSVLIANENMIEQGAGERYNDYANTIKYAAIVVTTVPILCVYPFLQKYFVKGVMIGAVKG